MPWVDIEERRLHHMEYYYRKKAELTPEQIEERRQKSREACERWRRGVGQRPRGRPKQQYSKPKFDRLDLIALRDPDIREGRELDDKTRSIYDTSISEVAQEAN